MITALDRVLEVVAFGCFLIASAFWGIVCGAWAGYPVLGGLLGAAIFAGLAGKDWFSRRL